METLTKECRRCNVEKPVTEFYERKRYNSYTSECKACMKKRSKTQKRLSKTKPRHNTEVVAIDYLNKNGFPALPGKAVSFADVDVVVWGHVRIEVKYSTANYIDGVPHFNWVTTPAQRERGLLADLVMLICDYNDGRKSFHLFKADNPVFYKDDHLKTGLTYFVGRDVPLKHGNNRVVMVDDMMKEAQNDLGLIHRVMSDISWKLRNAG